MVQINTVISFLTKGEKKKKKKREEKKGRNNQTIKIFY